MSNPIQTQIQRSALVPYDAEQMYALVADVERYSEFLPWCRRCRIVDDLVQEVQEVQEVQVRMEISRGPLHKSFITRNRMYAGRQIDLSLVEGPFNNLEACWQFLDLGTDGSRVSLEMEFEISNRFLRLSLAPVFAEMANSMVDAFCKRAVIIYGG